VNKLTTSRTRILFLSLMMPALAALACAGESPSQPAADVPHQERWGIYALNLESQAVELIYSSPDEITTLRLNTAGDRFVISQQIGGEGYEFAEIFTLGIDGQDPRRLTENACWDLYPAWSSDGTRIVFLSWRGADLDLYVMNADGSNLERFFDSGGHDADVDWVGDRIHFQQPHLDRERRCHECQARHGTSSSRRMGQRQSTLWRLRSQVEPRRRSSRF
jgi:hypothetical protein